MAACKIKFGRRPYKNICKIMYIEGNNVNKHELMAVFVDFNQSEHNWLYHR